VSGTGHAPFPRDTIFEMDCALTSRDNARGDDSSNWLRHYDSCLALGIWMWCLQFMPRRSPKSPILEALRSATADGARAVAFLEGQRWGHCPACPHCGDAEVYQTAARDGSRNKNFQWRCRGCKKMFTVWTSTVMEELWLPLRVWVYAFWKACSSKKGISAFQISREMEITHKSALFVLRRIRHLLGETNSPKLSGIVEADEC